MRAGLQLLSLLALGATIVPSVLFFADQMTPGTLKTTMLCAMILWFIVTPMWMDRPSPASRKRAD